MYTTETYIHDVWVKTGEGLKDLDWVKSMLLYCQRTTHASYRIMDEATKEYIFEI